MGGSSYIKSGSLEESQSQMPEQNPTERFSFGEAINRLKRGRRVAREGWNKKGLFVFMQVPAIIHIDTVPKMQSLPQLVKDEFKRREYATIAYTNQMAIVYPDNIISGWVPSASDVLETDWMDLD